MAAPHHQIKARGRTHWPDCGFLQGMPHMTSIYRTALNELAGVFDKIRDTEVDRALDTAILQGRDEIRIIHGIGKGILKKMISDMLKDHPSVKGTRDAEIRDGGKGVTIVLMK